MVAPGEHEPAGATPRWQPRPALAAAVAAVLLVPIGVSLVRTGELPFLGTGTVMLMTTVGEIREVSMADGSRVTLDTSTKLEVMIGRSRRNARLKYGRARFQVAQAAEPFVVEAAGATVTTRQGIIDVEQIGQQQGRVQVLAGAADVRGSGQDQAAHVTLGPGQAVIADSGGAERSAAVPSGPDWTRGMLQFDGTPLADAVARANRYSRRRIILVGDLGALRVTGAYRAGDTSGLARALAAAFGLSLQSTANGNLLLSRKGAPAHQE